MKRKGQSMKIRAVCRGEATTLPGKTAKTGIFKHAVQGAVIVDAEGIVSDAVCNRKHHGGPDQAIYAMGSVDLDFWSDTLGLSIEPGFSGKIWSWRASTAQSCMWATGSWPRKWC